MLFLCVVGPLLVHDHISSLIALSLTHESGVATVAIVAMKSFTLESSKFQRPKRSPLPQTHTHQYPALYPTPLLPK